MISCKDVRELASSYCAGLGQRPWRWLADSV